MESNVDGFMLAPLEDTRKSSNLEESSMHGSDTTLAASLGIYQDAPAGTCTPAADATIPGETPRAVDATPSVVPDTAAVATRGTCPPAVELAPTVQHGEEVYEESIHAGSNHEEGNRGIGHHEESNQPRSDRWAGMARQMIGQEQPPRRDSMEAMAALRPLFSQDSLDCDAIIPPDEPAETYARGERHVLWRDSNGNEPQSPPVSASSSLLEMELLVPERTRKAPGLPHVAMHITTDMV